MFTCSAEKYAFLYDKENREELLMKGVGNQRVKTVRAGELLYIASFPIWNTRAQAEQAKKEAQEAAARVKVDEQMKEIRSLDPTIRSMEDLAKMPTYPKFYELVKKGNTLTDAFKLANYDALTKGAAAGARQAALNAAQGKQHMGQTMTRGAGAVSVPAEVMEQYRAFNPDATEAEIRAHYAKNHRK